MISVVCVYNNKVVLEQVLLKSLRRQTAGYELIALDNTNGRFSSAAQALNYGGSQAKGDYIMFVHQDMWLETDTWLEDAEKAVRSIPDLGIAGVAGQSENGRNWRERCRWSIFELQLGPEGVAREPEVVQTLDECLLIVPRRVFDRLKFDEGAFDGWHCYGVDYCLSVRDLGLRAYVITGFCSHSCLRANTTNLLKYQRRLYRKHGKKRPRIYTWTGEISPLQLRLRQLKSPLGRVYSRVCAGVPGTLRKHLDGCETILDLGCGNHSILVYAGALPSEGYSVGVEFFEPALQESKRKFIHHDYIRADVRRLEFKPASFDAVVAIDLLEHLTREEGADLIRRMQTWARKRVLIFTTNGYVWQDAWGGNPLQVHRSGWKTKEFEALGFRVFGMNGVRCLRGYKSTVRFKPVLLWEIISGLTQRVTYHWPSNAFQLLCVKDMAQR